VSKEDFKVILNKFQINEIVDHTLIFFEYNIMI